MSSSRDDQMIIQAGRPHNDFPPKPASTPPASPSGVSCPASISWFAFTVTRPGFLPYQVPMWSGFLFGYAEVAVYTGIWQYVTDVYGHDDGGALAACDLPANGISARLVHLAVPPFFVWKGPALRKNRMSGGTGTGTGTGTGAAS